MQLRIPARGRGTTALLESLPLSLPGTAVCKATPHASIAAECPVERSSRLPCIYQGMYYVHQGTRDSCAQPSIG
jgi:hypothetical protein